MNKTKAKLPDKPSELIRVALADLEKCERSKKYRINMGAWCAKYGEVCYVCLAGAAMAKTLQMKPIRGDYWDSLTSVPEWNKLVALNCLRAGCVDYALGGLGIKIKDTEQFDRDITDYADNPKQFKADMRKLADDLEAAGL